MRFRLLPLLFSSLTLLFPWSATAQSLTISGSVADTQAVPIGEATVTLTTGASAGRRVASTDASGKYSFTGLTAGTYKLVFDHAGYEAASRDGFFDADLEISVALPVAGVVTSIDVTDVAGKATASRMDIPDRDLPVMVSSIPRQLLLQQGTNDVMTALRNASGVQAQRFYGVYEQYTIRGFNAADVMLVDGIRIEAILNRYNTQTNNVESIEVLKGPSSVLYGGDAVGGAINIIRKKPQGTRAYDLMYRGGRFNSHQVAGGATGPLVGNKLLYRVDASHDYSDGWRKAGARRTNVSPSLTWLINDRARVTVHQNFSRDRFKGDGGVAIGLLSVPNFDLSRRFSIPDDFASIGDSQTQIMFNVNLSPTWEFRNAFLLRKTSEEYFVTEGVYFDPGDTQVFRDGLYFHHHRKPVVNQADVVGRFDFLKMHHTVLLGYDYRDFYTRTDVTADGGYYGDYTPVNLVDPVENNPRITTFDIVRKTYQANRIHAMFWQDQIDLGRKLKINIGGRYDDFHRDRHRTFTDDPNTIKDVQTRNQNAYTYRAGIVYSPQGGHQVYFNTSTSFTPTQTIPSDGSELKPQTGVGYEVGHRWQGFNGRVKTALAWYRIENNNLSFSNSLTSVIQAGQAVSKGLDLDINADLGHGANLLLNYGYTTPKFTEFYDPDEDADYTGNAPRFTQRQAVNAWLTKGWTSGWTAGVGTRYLGPMYTNNANTIRLGGWTTFTGMVGYRRGMWEYAVNAENLLNRRRYFTGSDYQNQVYPGAPINVFATIRLRFNRI
jgi:iron complex outermembrane receptor protein